MTDEIAAYVFDDGPKPHELRQAHQVQRWGDPYGKGWRYWPHGMLDRCNTALNLYDICQSWKHTHPDKQGEWIEQNKKAWELIIAPLMEKRLGIENG